MSRKAAPDLEPIDVEGPAVRHCPTPPPAPLRAPRPAPAPRPHRVPRPPLTDVAFHRWVFAPLEASRSRVDGWAAGGSGRGVGRSRVLEGRGGDLPVLL